MELRCKTILVTGGYGGIGKAISKRLLEAKANVIVCGRDKEKLQNVIKELGSKNAYFLQWDITEVNQFSKKICEIEKIVGKIDGFVNCAGIGGNQATGRGYEPFDVTIEEWNKMVELNYTATFFMMRNEIDYMLANNIRGNILNIASNGAFTDIIGSYGSSKLSVIKWTRAFGKKYGHNGIIINGIAPGATATDMIKLYCKDENAPYPRHAIERFIKPYEIAELAHYLMSDYGEIICGHTVVADGGDNCAN